MSGASDSPIMPEIPHPSSRTVELGPRMPFLKNRFADEVIQEAKRGVIFQTT
jgi:hypothetical protein